MLSKKICYSELAYIIGVIALAIGTALMEKADFGMSMVVAPAYLLHLKISQFIPAFSFGMAEYVLQAVLIIILSVIMRKFKRSYLFSFVTAVIYGICLDLSIMLVGLVHWNGIVFRFGFYICGFVLCSAGVAFLFHTYIAPEAYELFVKEISEKLNKPISKVKTIYDCSSCLIGIVLSFAFFGLWHFEGVKFGTVFCALVNGWLIGIISKVIENRFEFKDLNQVYGKTRHEVQNSR